MDLMYEEQKQNAYNNLYTNVMQTIMFEKLNNHEKRMTELESENKNLHEELIRFSNDITNDNQFFPDKPNAKLDNYVNYKNEEKRAEQRLETIASKLRDVEDKKLQIQIVGELVEEINGMIKSIPKQKNNYRRQMLLMFHETLKQNYAKKLFSETQVKTLIEVARACHKSFITREQYFKMDDLLCECDLDMMPDLE